MAAFGKGGVLDAPSRLEREALTGRFLAAFGPSELPVVVAFAPGRANVIGEHTDYQEGLVLPFALDKKGAITDMKEGNVLQPLLVNSSAINLATETVRMILKIDDLVGAR